MFMLQWYSVLHLLNRGSTIGFSDPAYFSLLILPSPPSLRRNPDSAVSSITLITFMRWEAETEQSKYVNKHSRCF